MRIIRSIFIICLFNTFTFFGQTNKTIDSLEKILSLNTFNEQKINIHLQLYKEKKENDSLAYNHLKLADGLVDSETSDSTKVNILLHKTEYHLFVGQYDSVFYYANKGLKFNNSKSPNSIITLNSSKGVAYYFKGDYSKAIEAHLIAGKLSDSLKLGSGRARVYNNIGITYIKLKNWVKAEEYMNKSLEICKQYDIKRGISYTLGNLGIIYKNLGKPNKAIKIYLESISVSESLNDQRAIARTYSSIGVLYNEQKNYSEALLYAQKSLKIASSLDDKQLMSVSYFNKGETYTNLKSFVKAYSNFNKSLEIAKEIGALNNIKDIHFGLAKMYEDKGDFKNSISELKKYETLKDSINNVNHLTAISELEIEYNTQKKEKEIIQQQLQLEQKDNEIQKKQTQYSYMTGVAIFLLVSSVLVWFVLQQRQKRKNQEIVILKREHQIKTLESLIEGEEKERLRIAKELHDGVNSDLSAIKYKLTSMQEMSNKIINEAVEMIDKSCKQVRAISHNLVPPSLESFNLVEASEEYCQNMDATHSPQINFQHIGGDVSISKNAEINIFRIIQELVTNSIKHAKAAEINVQMSCRENTIQLTIEDNGKGFNKNQVETSGIGLKNVQSRIDYLQATIDLIANSQGTSYAIEIDTKKLDDN